VFVDASSGSRADPTAVDPSESGPGSDAQSRFLGVATRSDDPQSGVPSDSATSFLAAALNLVESFVVPSRRASRTISGRSCSSRKDATDPGACTGRSLPLGSREWLFMVTMSLLARSTYLLPLAERTDPAVSTDTRIDRSPAPSLDRSWGLVRPPGHQASGPSARACRGRFIEPLSLVEQT
jgi:hypothetical protein